ncbi:NAD(P)H-quinone oxidoreductase [Shewanella salipaludis]|uniref:Zinc-binding dehydrogenase n=1 Tax=Shewanella salipaludis TaxID=2723052 RepID=A0A972G3P7_9GAMM|nr:NAD(P)H-quinone oxidoreductase [Shewanella salipaludis]NMH66916.1 zinc-binding dehydrogenase [Shewanella salipaludis]
MPDLPKDYARIAFSQPGAPEVMHLSRSPLPLPAAGQVLIRVAAAGVNGPDIKQRVGAYPPPADASPILGLEVAGEICALGEGVNAWQLGDSVCALVPGGGYGEYVLTHASHCLPVPEGMSLVEAAALPETFFTVWGNLFMRAGLKPGESVLVHGGSGGIGSTAIQLAHALGARVIATTGSDDKVDYCRGLGADEVLNYRSRDFVEPVLALTRGQGVDVVFDIAGGDFINLNLQALAMDGRMVSVAMQRGAKAEVEIFRLMAKRIRWTGSTLRPQSVAAKAAIAGELREKVWPLLAEGKLAPHIFATFPLADAAKAHALMETGSHRGKLVLTV